MGAIGTVAPRIFESLGDNTVSRGLAQGVSSSGSGVEPGVVAPIRDFLSRCRIMIAYDKLGQVRIDYLIKPNSNTF